MPLKTILVHLNDERRAAETLAPAVALAERFNAHLVGLHVSPALMYVPPLPSIGGIVGLIEEHERRVSEAIGRAFTDATRNRGFASDLRILKPRGRDDVVSLVMPHARTADLIVAARHGAEQDTTSILDFPERFAVESGRPVLAVPPGAGAAPIGRRVLIAWNGKREAARAVFDGMALIEGAEKVVVLGLEQTRAGEALPLPDTGIAAALARHGFNVSVKTATVHEESVGAEILAQVAQEGADLLLMGAYGHMRLREFVFGGATRHVVRHMTVPTLFSH